MQNLKLKCSVKSGQMITHKNTQAFLHNNQRTNCSRRVFYEWTTAEFTATWRFLGMTAPYNSAAVTDVAIHSMHRKGYQSKLLVVYSKGGRCNFWGFTTITVNRHDELAAMDLSTIAVALKPSLLAWNLTVVPVWLYFSSFLFCFEHKTLYAIPVLTVFDFYYRT